MQEERKIYDKLCVMHSDISAIKTKQEAQDKDMRAVEVVSDGNEKFINKVKGGLILISSGTIITIVIRYVI